VLVRLRFSTINIGEVTGYAIAMAQYTNVDWGVVWYSGGKLAPDLTLPKLRHRWDSGSTTAHALAHTRMAAGERNSTYLHAARIARCLDFPGTEQNGGSRRGKPGTHLPRPRSGTKRPSGRRNFGRSVRTDNEAFI
jgi:hypothetical protein